MGTAVLESGPAETLPPMRVTSPACPRSLPTPSPAMARRRAGKAALFDLGALLPVRDGLSAGGRRIRTCMGLFLSSSGFVGGSLFGAGKPFFVPSPAIRFAE